MADEYEPLPDNKSLALYVQKSIVPNDVIARISKKPREVKTAIENIETTYQNKVLLYCIGTGALFLIMTLLTVWSIGLVALIAATYYAYTQYKEDQKKQEIEIRERVKEVSNVTYHCPHCSVGFNVARGWLCGTCGNQHGQNERNRHAFTSPFLECASRDCSGRKQVAMQCPNSKCSRHIILDQSGYNSKSSYETPYLGVARFQGDNNQPQVPANMETFIFSDDLFE